MSARVIDRPGVRSALGVVGLVAAVGCWQAVGSRSTSPFIVPFSTAVDGLVDLVTGPGLFDDIVPSVIRAGLGFVLATVIGVAVGGFIGHERRLEPWVRPQLEFLRATPIPAILPVAILVLGPTSTMRVLIITLGAVWPVLLNTVDGVRSVDPRYVEAARIAGYNQFGIIRRVVLRAAMPNIFAGIRVALSLALIVMVVSEMIASSSGLGNYVLQAQRTFSMTRMYSGVLALGIIGGIFTAVFTVVERRALRWHIGLTKGSQ